MPTPSDKKFTFITLPRMGTKHIQDQLVRAFDVQDHVEGHETLRYRGREFKMSLGEYFRNYGFVEHIQSNAYFENGELHFDRDGRYLAGLPSGCYAYQIAYEGRWCFVKRGYINYYVILERDFQEKYALLREFGKSYVIKVLFNQHKFDQLDKILKLTENVVCYLKVDVLSWVCSYSLVDRYLHTDPQRIEPTEIPLQQVEGLMGILPTMINFCRERRVPIIVNQGEDMRIFGQLVKNFTTPEFSRFQYKDIIRNYGQVAALVNDRLGALDI